MSYVLDTCNRDVLPHSSPSDQ